MVVRPGPIDRQTSSFGQLPVRRHRPAAIYGPSSDLPGGRGCPWIARGSAGCSKSAVTPPHAEPPSSSGRPHRRSSGSWRSCGPIGSPGQGSRSLRLLPDRRRPAVGQRSWSVPRVPWFPSGTPRTTYHLRGGPAFERKGRPVHIPRTSVPVSRTLIVRAGLSSPRARGRERRAKQVPLRSPAWFALHNPAPPAGIWVTKRTGSPSDPGRCALVHPSRHSLLRERRLAAA